MDLSAGADESTWERCSRSFECALRLKRPSILRIWFVFDDAEPVDAAESDFRLELVVLDSSLKWDADEEAGGLSFDLFLGVKLLK